IVLVARPEFVMLAGRLRSRAGERHLNHGAGKWRGVEAATVRSEQRDHCNPSKRYGHFDPTMPGRRLRYGARIVSLRVKSSPGNDSCRSINSDTKSDRRS